MNKDRLNGDGRRVIKSVNGAATYYLYEYDKVVLETNIFGDVTGRNVYGLNLLIRTVGVDTFYYMYNGHADVTALLTPEGDVAASYYYDAFGNILEQTGDISNSILFAGYQYDKETGLYYLNARMYDPVTARFMQEDTYAGQQRDPLSLNLYTYCHNSPLMYYDPTGHYTEYVNQTRGYYNYHGNLLSMDSASDNLAQREMRRAMNAEYPGKAISNPGEAAMVSAGYGGDAFKTAPVVYKEVRISREVKTDNANSRPIQDYEYQMQMQTREDAKKSAISGMISGFDGNEAALDLINKGLELYDTYRWEYRAKVKGYLIAAGIEPTEENVEFVSIRTFIGNYLLAQIQDPESAKPSWSGFVDFVNQGENKGLGVLVRTADTIVKGAVGLYNSVEGAGRSIGDYYFSSHTSDKAVEAARHGEISWDECYNIWGEEETIRRSIALGNGSGFIDVAIGIVTGIPGALDYICNNRTIIQQSTGMLISAKDDAILDSLELSREDYMQGKSIATVEVVVATLAIMLGKSMAANAAKAQTRSTIDNANYAQKTYNSKFSAEGAQKYTKLAGQPIKTVNDLANAIKNGLIDPKNIPVDYIIRDGNTLILNTRTAQALTQAGIPRSSWTTINQTGNTFFENSLTNQLVRNELTSEGISSVNMNGGR